MSYSLYNGFRKILIPLPSLEGTVTPQPDSGPAAGTQTYDFTNQQLINAFYKVYKARGGDADDYWQAIVDAELEFIATNRQGKYTGLAIKDLPNLPDDVKRSVASTLGV